VTGALAGLRIIEMAGIGPGPFCGMMLADHGAEVIRIERPGSFGPGLAGDPLKDPMLRSRRSIAVNVKEPDGIEIVRQLCATADGIIEGFRPGVMERLGLGPEKLIQENPRLVYGRITGWGQTGPLSQTAGHDINYTALSGTLAAVGLRGERPVAPVNLVGDFGGGGMMLAFGMVSAILSAKTSGVGQIVDCAMTDGAALLSTMIWGLRAAGMWDPRRGTNLLDTGAHFYDTYECADGKFVAVGAIEPEFYAKLLGILGLENDAEFRNQFDRTTWPALRERLGEIFLLRTRTEWCDLLEKSDACVSPVLEFDEVAIHPHNTFRKSIVSVNGVDQPAPAPRLSHTPTKAPVRPRRPGQDGPQLLSELGYSTDRVALMLSRGVISTVP